MKVDFEMSQVPLSYHIESNHFTQPHKIIILSDFTEVQHHNNLNSLYSFKSHSGGLPIPMSPKQSVRVPFFCFFTT